MFPMKFSKCSAKRGYVADVSLLPLFFSLPIFNKAIIFDTTQKSWHGFPEPIHPPEGKMRKSFAVYYMTDITSTAEERYRARYVGV